MTEVASAGSTSTPSSDSGSSGQPSGDKSGLSSQHKAIAEVKGTRPVANSSKAAEVAEDSDDNEGNKVPAVDEMAELAKKKYRMKVDGKDTELTVEEMARDYSLKQASMKRFEEATKIKKQSDAFMEALLKDPKSVLSHPTFAERGLNLRSFAESILKEEIEREMLTPEELEYKKERSELEELRREKSEYQKKQEDQEFQRHKQKAEHEFTTKFTEALDYAKIPKNAFTIKRMAEYQRQALKGGFDLTAKELGDLIKEEVHSDLKGVSGDMDAESLIGILGEEIVKKIREYDLKRVQQPAAPANHGSQLGVKKSSSRAEKMTARDFSEQMRKQYGV